MKRHLIDRSKPRKSGARLSRFLQAERQAMPRAVTKALQRRPMAVQSGRMLSAFARVERSATR